MLTAIIVTGVALLALGLSTGRRARVHDCTLLMPHDLRGLLTREKD